MVSWKQFHLLLSTSSLSTFLPSQVAIDSSLARPGCFGGATTLNDVINCHLLYVVQANYTQQDYNAAQPTDAQRAAWSVTVSSLLKTDGNCTAVASSLPTALKGIYNVFELKEPAPSSASFCVLAENVSDSDREYKKGWGIMVVPSTRSAVSRYVHLSALRPRFALETQQQAVTVFQGIGAKSLYIPGRLWLVYPTPTSCVTGKVHFITDPTYDQHEMFFDTQSQIINWQTANGGCPSSTCAYVQFNSKGVKVNQQYQVDISVGLDNSTGWYTKHNDYPAKRIKLNLGKQFPSWKIALPSDSTGAVTATDNIEGRLINGVDAAHVCTKPASPDNTTGKFVHLGESTESRIPSTFDKWVKAFIASFGTTCAKGMVTDSKWGLCVKK
ncbi:hypothetical protein AMATHDRAFT_70297 [Amanita thiersii Skay4041]|uniref:Secreted protein n=1 Tax=Amanita thiersii Skay4041 TaxID=703135 RepID=A0A2A9N7S4_9AGAR|nr:hypothetical protein AMATHDRAFT_70297 [Amanita thiersii Skay4041]